VTWLAIAAVYLLFVAIYLLAHEVGYRKGRREAARVIERILLRQIETPPTAEGRRSMPHPGIRRTGIRRTPEGCGTPKAAGS
jgi:hypothetical protein